MKSFLRDIIEINTARLTALRCWLFHREHHVKDYGWRYLGCSCGKCEHRWTGSKL